MATQLEGIEVSGTDGDRFDEILTPDALEFVATLQREFGQERDQLLVDREARAAEFHEGVRPDFLAKTRQLREQDWKVAEPPSDYADRRVEITGPTNAKMVINALNSGARGFMADFEDSNSPTWHNMIDGQLNLRDAIDGTLEWDSPEGKEYRLNEERATLLVRPRGWHLSERHLKVDGKPVTGAFVDFGLYFFHNCKRLLDNGSGPYFYLPKMESHLEARLWNEVFELSEKRLDVGRGTIRATVLIETIPAAFEMDEILYELRDHSLGLNAGRWDYIFSMIKSFRDDPAFLLPDRNKVTMTVPFMRAYTELLVKTCHRRGAFAMGGMSAVIPSRKDEEAAARAKEKVADDKEREAGDGFDGSWVAHPDSVEVALEQFDKVLEDKPNQIDKQRDDVSVEAAQLLDARSAGHDYTREGLNDNVNVGIQYISSWLRGNGAAAIHGLMEDAATAEISRSQVWQWIRHGVELDDGTKVTKELVQETAVSELEKIREEVGDKFFKEQGRPDESRRLFEQVALADEYPVFLTLPAYDELEG